MKLSKHIAAIAMAAGALTVIAVPAVLTAAPAMAGTHTGFQWAYEFSTPYAYLNAWGGGPLVKVYEQPGAVNNDFTLVLNHAYNKYQLEFTGNGVTGLCIGDQNNDPNNGYAALVPCGFSGGAGWGTLMDLGSCGDTARCFQDDHWSSVQNRTDWLGPVNSYSNGSPFTLNNAGSVPYFYFYNAA